MGDRMRKRVYLSLFILLSLSIVLFSVSYSEKSGVVQYNNYEKSNKELKVIYENSNSFIVNKVAKLDDYENLDTSNINIINLNNKSVSYALKIDCKDCYNKVYYSTKNGEKELIKDNITYLGDLQKYGNKNDSVLLNVRFFSNEEYKDKLIVNIITIDSSSLNYFITSSDGTYEKNGKYIYNKNNNYIMFNDKLWRILDTDGDKVRIVNFGEQEKYNASNNYLTKEDLLNTFKEDNVNKDNFSNYDSWIKEIDEFWLKDKEFYEKGNIINGDDDILVVSNIVDSISSSLKVIKGDGTKDSPYEVEYEG